jgi:uncharacterized protein YraI
MGSSEGRRAEMIRRWRVIISSTVILAVCDAAFGQDEPSVKPPKSAPESMHVGARITDERVNVRQGPGSEYDRTRLVDRETKVTVTAREGSWVQVTLPNGASGWVGLKFVDPESAIVTPKASALNAVDASSDPAISKRPIAPATQAQSATAPALAQKPVKPPVKPVSATPAAVKSSAAVEKDILGALSGTKPDVLVGAKDSPPASLGDSFRMLLILLPVLGGIVLAVRGLKSLQRRTGSLPDFRKGVRGAILGGFNLNNARSRGGSSLRVLESIPIGSASLHLVEARGRVLLLGASGASLSTLADLTESQSDGSLAAEDSDFRTVLNTMTDDLDDDYSDLRGGLGITVGSLEDQIRETREAISRSAVRGRR